MRFRRAVGQTRQPIRSVTSNPFGDGGAGDLQSFSDAGLNPAVLDDEFDEFEAPSRRLWRVEVGNVRDEGLRGIE